MDYRNQFADRRKAAVWAIIRSPKTTDEKARALHELAEREVRHAYGRGVGAALRNPSALQAGKLRRASGGHVSEDVDIEEGA